MPFLNTLELLLFMPLFFSSSLLGEPSSFSSSMTLLTLMVVEAPVVLPKPGMDVVEVFCYPLLFMMSSAEMPTPPEDWVMALIGGREGSFEVLIRDISTLAGFRLDN